MYENILTEEERVSLELRSLYQKYGYLPYKMSRFEGYDLYVANKEFLVGDGAITFNDTDGRLLALKPDVTLSILKNDGEEGEKRKVYYDENVYRISPKTRHFKEIRQVGLECLGDIGGYDVFETVFLAAESLAKISENFLLCISHLGLVSALLEEVGGEAFAKQAMGYLAEKNAHEGEALCARYGVDSRVLKGLISAYGVSGKVLPKIKPLCQSGKAREAYATLENLCLALAKTKYADKILVDFSVGGDMHYYDDILFKGFIEGVGEGILSGGRYDKLLQRLGKNSGAIGFAVSLDALDGFGKQTPSVVDVLLLCDKNTSEERIANEVQALVSSGKSVRVQTQASGVRYRQIVDIRGCEV